MHFHHFSLHCLFYVGVFDAHEVHEGLFDVLTGDTLLDKDRVFDLGMVNEHINRLCHFVLLGLRLLLHVRLGSLYRFHC